MHAQVYTNHIQNWAKADQKTVNGVKCDVPMPFVVARTENWKVHAALKEQHFSEPSTCFFLCTAVNVMWLDKIMAAWLPYQIVAIFPVH